MNEIGEDCYFLLSGKVSILKPVEYPNIKLTYKQYFIYLKNLLDLKEIDLLTQILNKNKKFLDVVNIDEVIRLIKVYFASTLKKELKKKLNGITLDELEEYFKEFNYKLEDFQINKEKMIKEIRANMEIDSNIDIMIKNYICDNMKISTEDLFLLDMHNVFNIERERKAPLVNLVRYEIFLFLYPGSFFGDAALEAKIKKRNATIRAEEDCIICSLSNEYYGSLIAEENKRLKIIDLQFLVNNFFFKEISPTIFNKYYYPMFTLSEKYKKDVIFKANDKLSSILLLKDGTIKTEICANMKDLLDLIKKLIKALYVKSNNLKISVEELMELRKQYLKDDFALQGMDNKDYILSSRQPKHIYNLYYSDGFECLGIIEYFLNINFITTCTVVSDKAIFMEIKRDDLNRIIKNDKEILPNYYNFVYMNALSLTRRIYFLKNNILNQLVTNLNEKTKIKKIFMDNSIGNNHKQRVEIINSDKVKKFYKKKIKDKKDKLAKKVGLSNNISSQKNVSNIKDITFRRDESSLVMRDYLDMTKTTYDKKKWYKSIHKYSTKNEENEKNREKKNSIVNIRNKILSINLIRKKIIKEMYKKKNLKKLSIISNYNLGDEKSIIEEKKYFDDKSKISRIPDEKNSLSKTKEIFSDYYTTIKQINYRTIKNEKSYASIFPNENFKSSDNKIKNLIKQMKQKHSINLGQRKFIFYRKSKMNKVYDNLIKEKSNESRRQKSARNIIKDYYFKKKIEGYSSIINPINNTYINRQKTYKIKRNVNISK